jgi:membrane protein required for colicin V production
MSWVDVTIVTALIVSAVLGLFWGLIRQVAATFGLILGIVLAGAYYKNVSGFLHPDTGGGLIGDPNVANLLAFVLILVGVSLGIGIIASVLRTVLGLLFLGWLDHLLGALLGVFQMALLMAVVIFVATMFPVGGLSDAIRASSLAPFVAQVFSFALAWLPPEFNTVRLLLNMAP